MRFAKLAKEAGLLGGALTPQAVDLVFALAKGRKEARK